MSWSEFNAEESKKDYYQKLQKKIDYLYSPDVEFFTRVFPPKHLIYRCFDETPLNEVRVVIIGQDIMDMIKQMVWHLQ